MKKHSHTHSHSHTQSLTYTHTAWVLIKASSRPRENKSHFKRREGFRRVVIAERQIQMMQVLI